MLPYRILSLSFSLALLHPGGKKEIMEVVAPAGPMYQAGTLSGNPLAMTAGIKTLEILKRPGSYEVSFICCYVVCLFVYYLARALCTPRPYVYFAAVPLQRMRA